VLGRAVSGEEGIARMPGKENISTAGGNCGTTVQGPLFSSPKEETEGLGIAGGDGGVGTWGTSAVTPVSEAAMAWKSASFSVPVGTDHCVSGCAETEFGVGTAGGVNISR
jgi:hypothetical protein